MESTEIQCVVLGDRLREARKALKLKQTAFGEPAGIKQDSISDYENNRNIPYPKTIDAISKAHGINRVWLETGEGEMFDSAKSIPKGGELIPAKKAQLFLNELPEKEAEMYIPYYDVEITAGKIELYFDDVDEIPEGYVYAPQYQGCVMCNVKGNSMYDLIYPGARLYVFRMDDIKYIDFGQIYLVITNSLRILKYIKRHPTDDSKVVLASHNPNHDSWDIEKIDIISLFLVKGFENQTAM